MAHQNPHPVKFEEYVHQDYPRLLHHTSALPVLVLDKDEEANAYQLGYRRIPSEAAEAAEAAADRNKEQPKADQKPEKKPKAPKSKPASD